MQIIRPLPPLRQRLLEDMQIRNDSPHPIDSRRRGTCLCPPPAWTPQRGGGRSRPSFCPSSQAWMAWRGVVRPPLAHDGLTEDMRQHQPASPQPRPPYVSPSSPCCRRRSSLCTAQKRSQLHTIALAFAVARKPMPCAAPTCVIPQGGYLGMGAAHGILMSYGRPSITVPLRHKPQEPFVVEDQRDRFAYRHVYSRKGPCFLGCQHRCALQRCPPCGGRVAVPGRAGPRWRQRVGQRGFVTHDRNQDNGSSHVLDVP